MTPGPRYIICYGLNHHFRCCRMQKDPYIMIPSLFTPSGILISCLLSTISFYKFCHTFAPPWMTPRPHHIICSSLNHHFRCCSMQKCPYIMIPSLTPSPILILRQVSTMDYYLFYIIFAPPWTTPGPWHIICSELNHHLSCRSMQKSPYMMIPSIFTPSQILVLCLFSTMPF